MLHTNTIITASSVPSTLARRNALRIAAICIFTGLTALAAMVRIPMPGTPVPATLQTLVVVLAGILLAGRLATISMAAYLALGSAGVVLFAAAGGSTLGYLVGFVLAQPVIAVFARPRGSRGAQVAWLGAAVAAGHAVIFACGLAWLWVWSGQPLGAVIAMGFLPFAGVDLALKSAAAIAIGSLAMGRVRRMLEIS
ncbi:MAG: biotin transporter BioY [Phycisphaerales bacterium]|nr:biotin transporter BioY [Phycisphaerales bacterium]